MMVWIAHDHYTGEILTNPSLSDLMENVKMLCLYHRCQISDFTFRTASQ